jgi:hypothetical protein
MFVSLHAGQALAAAGKPKEENCSIEGRVINSVTGAPLPRVTLALTGAARVTAAGGEDGRFAFQGLAAGRYTLIAPAAGGASSGGADAGAGGGNGQAAGIIRGTALRRAPGSMRQPATTVRFELRTSSMPGGTMQ